MPSKKYIQINDAKIPYLSSGSKKNLSIIFLHDFNETPKMWSNQLDSFSNNYYVVAPDFSKYSKEHKQDIIDTASTATIVNDIKELLLTLNESAVLVGYGWGGILAYITAASNPNLVDRLVIINPLPPNVYQRLTVKTPTLVICDEQNYSLTDEAIDDLRIYISNLYINTRENSEYYDNSDNLRLVNVFISDFLKRTEISSLQKKLALYSYDELVKKHEIAQKNRDTISFDIREAIFRKIHQNIRDSLDRMSENEAKSINVLHDLLGSIDETRNKLEKYAKEFKFTNGKEKKNDISK